MDDDVLQGTRVVKVRVKKETRVEREASPVATDLVVALSPTTITTPGLAAHLQTVTHKDRMG